MKKAFDDYTWIAGGSGMRGSLWQGPDHLLVIEARGFVFPYREVYRRIDYKNIQALTLARTSRFAWITVLLSVVLASFASFWFSMVVNFGWKTPAAIVALPIALVVLLLLLWHIIRGRTCRCALQTAVLSLRLRPLRRIKHALPALEKIESLCRLHQGDVSAEHLAAHDAGTAHKMPAVLSSRLKWTGSRIAQSAMFLLMLWGAMFAGEMFVTNAFYMIGHIILALLAFGLVVASLAQSLRVRMPGGLLGILIGAVALLFISGLTLLGLLIASITVAEKHNPPSDVFATFIGFNFAQAHWAAWLVIALGGIGILLGLAGLPFASMRQPHTAPGAPALPPDLNGKFNITKSE